MGIVILIVISSFAGAYLTPYGDRFRHGGLVILALLIVAVMLTRKAIGV